MSQTIRLRFAPSPTGHLHIGGARTALFNWLLAKKLGGKFILRLEDTDLERSLVEHEQEILKDLAWMGLNWDEGPQIGGPFGPYRQSERNDIYQEVTEKLIEQGHAYRCTCSPERLENLRNAAMESKDKVAYDGLCREANHGPDCGPHVVRFKMPQEGETVVDDLIKGRVVFANSQLDDFVIRRSDMSPIYNFVVVVDDHLMQVTHVLRGDDHLNNTPKQVQIYKALGAEPPKFGHMPLILGIDGKRLSKRHGATSLGAYKDMGYLPHAMTNYLARLGWSSGDQEIFSLQDLINAFEIGDIGKAAGKWDTDKLLWVNQHWISATPVEELVDHALPFFNNVTRERLLEVLPTVTGRSKTLLEVAEKAAFYFVSDNEIQYDPKSVRKFLKPEAAPILEKVLEIIKSSDWTHESLETGVKALLEDGTIKLGQIAQPVRVSITGSSVGPGLYETLLALGRQSSIARIQSGINLCKTS